MASLYNILDIAGAVLGVVLIYLISSYIKDEKDSSFLTFLKAARVGIILWVLNNLWHAGRQMLNFEQYWGEAAEYPEYLLIIFAYLAFIIAAYQTKFISKQFAFEEAAKKNKGGKRK